MKKSELFRLIHRQSLGDCTEVYDSELLKPFSVKEFVEAVLEDEKEWGYINIESNIHPSASLEYSHGEIVNNNIGEAELEKTVTSLKANGGWSRMDFLITIGTSDEKRETPKESIEKKY